jgi:uracil-DNA glycosylase family 4
VTDPGGPSVHAGLLARLLRQRAELGTGPLFLEGMDRDEAMRAVRMPRGGLTATSQATRPAPTPPAPSGRPGADGTAESAEEAETRALPVLPDDYEALRDLALGCTRCRLSGTRTQVVFSDGVPTARLAVVGEAPGANEDRTGLPFVGAAGKLLDLMLRAVDLSREDTAYICNVLKCRPPGNRNPLPDEIDACAPLLRKQIELVAPEVVLAVGTFSAQWLTGRNDSLGKLRGDVHSYPGVPVVVTYHPAALLRNPGWNRAAWDDLQLLRQVLDGG